MLYLHFINVGDGDAVLLEEWTDGAVFRLLVDAGRADVGAYPGSRRTTAAAYLANIPHLDALVITHLHTDHFAGLSPLLERTAVDTACSGFFPRLPVGPIVRTGTEEKTVRGLMDCLDQWAALTARLQGCRLIEAETSLTLDLTPRLRAEIIVPDAAAAARQRRIWSSLLAGEQPDRDMVWWSSKYRNPGSLRLRVHYAGRRIELAGDCYGAAWEDEAVPCDILKVPHHGDAKSVTPLLLDRLRPRHAVVSCSAAYNARKDRPSPAAIELLEARGTRVWFTDSFARPGHAPDRWTSVDFLIRPDGSILPPDSRNHLSLIERESAGRSI